MSEKDALTGLGGPAPRRERAARWAWFFAILTALVGVGASIVLSRQRLALERQRAVEQFGALAESLLGQTIREIGLFMEVLDSIRQLHTLSDRVSNADFDEFVRKGMLHQRRILGAYGFAQRIPEEYRASFESSGGSNAPPVAISEADGQGGFPRTAGRPVYFPLTYQNPALALGVPLGYDFGARAEDRLAIEFMMLTGQFALGGAVYSEARALPENGYYMFAPIIYSGEGAPASGYLFGFAVAVFRPQSFLAAVRQTPTMHGVSMQLLPASSPEPAAPLYFTQRISVGNQEWAFRCRADERYLAAQHTRQPELILGAGLLVTLLLTSQLVFVARRARQIEAVVRARTRELSDANAQLAQEMRERMRLEEEIIEVSNREKMRVGRDLHDSLGQKLTGASFLCRALQTQVAGEGAGNLAQINETLKEAIAQVRRIARGLSPVELTGESFHEALRRLAEEVAAVYAIQCDAYVEDETVLPETRAAGHLYSIAQEAISNAVRHGKARNIVMTLDREGAQGLLAIEDDGCGLPADAPSKGGMGLKIMRYRAEMYHGTVAVSPGQQKGTVVYCRFPLPAAQPPPPNPKESQ